MEKPILTPDNTILAGFVRKTVDWVNKWNQYAFIVLILLFYFLRFRLSINEEHYFQLSKAYFDPAWLPNSFTLSEFASTRILFQLMVGFLLEYLPFEVVSALCQLFWSLAIAVPLAMLYRLLNLSNIDFVLHIPILYLWNSWYSQSFFGFEWIFHGIEPKVFAYLFLMFALYYLLTERYSRVAVFLAAATYFHILVGGWFMIYFSLYHLLSNRSIKKAFIFGAIYVACLIPMIIYLLPSIIHAISPTDLPVHPDWIYTYFKQPYHTALFLSIPFFIAQHGDGVLQAAAFLLMCIFVFSLFTDEINQKINRLNIIIFAGVFFCVILAYFDTNGSFVKYFPFRVTGLLKFLVLLQIVYLIKKYFLWEGMRRLAQFSLLVWFVVAVSPRHFGSVAKDFYNFYSSIAKTDSWDKLTAYIQENTNQDDVFLLVSSSAAYDNFFTFDMAPSFMRDTRRDLFVAYNFAPVSPGTDKVYQWYVRLQAKNEIVQNHEKICEVKNEFRIDYWVTDFKLDNVSCIELVHSEGEYYLYKITSKQ